MGKDLFLIDTRCHLNRTLEKAFTRAGYEIEIATDVCGLPDEVLRQAKGFTAVCVFINKMLKPEQIDILKENGNELLLCCSNGFDNIPIDKCKQEGIRVARVPSFSPPSIAEYAISSMLALAKNMQKSYKQTKNADFTIGGLQCILMEDKTVGVIGTGQIGKKTVEKVSGLCDKVLCYDAFPNQDWIKGVANAEYVDLDELLTHSNFISIHVPLIKETHYLINRETIQKMRKHVIIINTSRGEIIKTEDLVEALREGKIFGVALDVFEGEKEFIYKDMSEVGGFHATPLLEELSKMDNVIISSHIAFYTDESIKEISSKTLSNFEAFIGKVKLDDKAFIV